MDIQEIALDLKACCEQGDFQRAIDRHYSDDIVSVEPVGNDQMPAEMRGIESIRGKNEWFANAFDVHTVECDGPFVADDGFALQFRIDATNKASGERSTMSEMAKYTVTDGKIVREEFFYHAG